MMNEFHDDIPEDLDIEKIRILIKEIIKVFNDCGYLVNIRMNYKEITEEYA